MTTTRIPIARNWIGMRVGDTKIIRTLDCYQIQSQVGKVRKKHPECSDWRWATARRSDGSVVVTRVR